jgi:hypothetical protein
MFRASMAVIALPERKCASIALFCDAICLSIMQVIKIIGAKYLKNHYVAHYLLLD